MARIAVDPNYNSPTFPRATAGTDLFVKEDVQALAAAMSTHDHSAGKGLPMVAGSIPDGSITSAKIANGTIVAADIAPGTITSNEIANGTIATADLADASVTNAKLASDTARANLLTNGGFEVWQRGNGPFTTGAPYCADRWQLSAVGGSTFSVSRDSANVDAVSQYCMVVTYTHVAASDIYTQLKAEHALRGKTVTASVRVRCPAANSVRFRMNDGVSGAVQGSFNTASGAYETISQTYAVAASSASLTIAIEFNASGTFYVDNAMLVVGSVAADYAPLHPADDLARCLRYYEVHANLSAGTPVGVGQAWSTTQASVPFQYRAIKPAVPTITLSANTDFQLESAVFGALALNGFSAVAPVYTGVDLRPTVASGLVAGNATLMAAANANAKLILEANP